MAVFVGYYGEVYNGKNLWKNGTKIKVRVNLDKIYEERYIFGLENTYENVVSNIPEFAEEINHSFWICDDPHLRDIRSWSGINVSGVNISTYYAIYFGPDTYIYCYVTTNWNRVLECYNKGNYIGNIEIPAQISSNDACQTLPGPLVPGTTDRYQIARISWNNGPSANLYWNTASITYSTLSSNLWDGVEDISIKLSDCGIEYGPKRFVYNGSERKPTVIVSDNTHILTENADYTLTYENNVDIGTAHVIVTGIGDYEGTRTIDYEIYEDNVPSRPFPYDKKYFLAGWQVGRRLRIWDAMRGDTLTPKPEPITGAENLANWVLHNYGASISHSFSDDANYVAITPSNSYEEWSYKVSGKAGYTYTLSYLMRSPSGFSWQSSYWKEENGMSVITALTPPRWTMEGSLAYTESWEKSRLNPSEDLPYSCSVTLDTDKDIYCIINFQCISDGVRAQFVFSQLRITGMLAQNSGGNGGVDNTDTGIGWTADAQYLVSDANTYLGATGGRTFYKTNEGPAIAFLMNLIGSSSNYSAPSLLSTVAKNTYNSQTSETHSYTIDGVTWYININNGFYDLAATSSYPKITVNVSNVDADSSNEPIIIRTVLEAANVKFTNS